MTCSVASWTRNSRAGSFRNTRSIKDRPVPIDEGDTIHKIQRPKKSHRLTAAIQYSTVSHREPWYPSRTSSGTCGCSSILSEVIRRRHLGYGECPPREPDPADHSIIDTKPSSDRRIRKEIKLYHQTSRKKKSLLRINDKFNEYLFSLLSVKLEN